jgi:hypothetical protein
MFELVEALDALTLTETLLGVGEKTKFQVNIDTLGRHYELEDAGELRRSNSSCLVVVVERDLIEAELHTLRVHVRHRTNGRV